MNRRHMLYALNHVDISEMPHIFCPSYMRPVFKTAEMFRGFCPEIQQKIHIVVRPEQYEAYKQANPEFHILSMDDYPVHGLASTRQFIFEYAVKHRYSMIIDMDDDIVRCDYLYGSRTAAGKPTSKHSLIKDRVDDPMLQQKVLLLASHIAREVFHDHPDVCLGNIIRQRFSYHSFNSQRKYVINQGPTPRQVTILNVKGLYKMGINRRVDLFDRHGDDIGFCAEILRCGGSLFNIPSLCYDYISEKCDSVMRTPENEKELHAYEYAMLQKLPIKDYLKVSFTDDEGNYMWGDIDWRKYHKLYHTDPIRVLWRDDPFEKGINAHE